MFPLAKLEISRTLFFFDLMVFIIMFNLFTQRSLFALFVEHSQTNMMTSYVLILTKSSGDS